MAKTKHEPGAGDVPIVLGGERMVLRPGLEACRAINKLAGNSLAQAVSKIMERLDFDFIVEVVALGLDATSPHLKRELAEKVYQQGVISIAADCVLYVRTIMNGGTRPVDDDVIRTLELVDSLLTRLPERLRGHAPALEAVRAAVMEEIAAEVDEGTEDPLAQSQSASESITTA